MNKKRTTFFICTFICILILLFKFLLREQSFSVPDDTTVSETPLPSTEDYTSPSDKNLIITASSAYGYWDSSGTLVSSDSIKHTDFIPVSVGSTYKISVTYAAPQIILFDEYFTMVQTIEHMTEEGNCLEKIVTIEDKRVKYMSINYDPNDEDYLYAYEQTTVYPVSTKLKVGFIGDSITDGYMRYGETIFFTNFTYPSILSTKLDIIPYEYAISGVLLCGSNSILNQLPPMQDDLDAIVILIGINDFTGPQLPLGSKTDFGDTSFCGMYNLLLQTLIETYGNIPIICLTPLEMYYSVNDNTNHMGDSLKDYASAILNIGSNYDHVTVIDTYSWSQTALPPSSKEFFTDSLHPTQKGHFQIADYLYKELSQIPIFIQNKHLTPN